MEPIRITVIGEPIASALNRNIAKQQQRVQKAIGAAAAKLGDSIVAKGREDISSAGKFGARWTTSGLTYDITPEGIVSTINIREAVPYWRVFQYGAVISGKPLLWIPLSFATEAQGVSAKDFPGRLFRVDRKSGGVPLLLSAEDKQPKYHGQESVTIPKKFHLVEIATLEAQKFGELYKIEMASGG
jgi:hypothetical protein